MLLRMKIMAVTLVAMNLVGCASYPELAEFGRAIQQATDDARASGASTGSGSVASGGTGYLPCPTASAAATTSPAECK